MSQIRLIQTPNQQPTTAQLAVGDIGINFYDGKAYIKKLQGSVQTIVEIGGGSSISASYALSSSYAANGGVTQLIAGSNITLSPADGKGIVTINASTGGGGSGVPNGPNYSLQYNNGGNFSGSGNFTLLNNNALYLTGSFNVSGSTIQRGNNTLVGTTTLTGSIFINGNIIPQLSSSFDLGSVTNPWRSIYVQSGSISIQSDIPGGPPAVISNANGNVSIAAAGFQIQSGSVIPFDIEPTGRTIIRVPNIPANDVGGFSIIGNTSGLYQPITAAGGMVHITGNDGQVNRFNLDAFGSGSTTSFNGVISRAARGTVAAPSQSKAGDVTLRISSIGWRDDTGFGGTSIPGGTATSLDFIVLEDQMNNARGSAQQFYNAPIGTLNRVLSAQIDATGIQTSGSVRAASFTGSLFGTSSWASNAQTASYVNTLNQNVVITGSLSLSAGSALNINDGFYVNGNKQFNYGQFSSTQTQSGSANTAYSATFNTTDFSQGVSLISGSRITVSNTGIYNIQFSTQLHTTSNEAVDFSIWFARTGSNIANSNTDFTVEKINGGGFQVAALNFLTLISSGSYVELKYSKTTTNGQLQAKGIQSTPTRPATPSVILTVTQIA